MEENKILEGFKGLGISFWIQNKKNTEDIDAKYIKELALKAKLSLEFANELAKKFENTLLENTSVGVAKKMVQKFEHTVVKTKKTSTLSKVTGKDSEEMPKESTCEITNEDDQMTM